MPGTRTIRKAVAKNSPYAHVFANENKFRLKPGFVAEFLPCLLQGTRCQYSPCNRRGRNSATIPLRSEACHNGGQPLSAEACALCTHSARGGYEHDGQPFDIAATNAALRGHRLARPSVLRIPSKDPQQVRAFPLDANLGLIVITHRRITHHHHSLI